MKFSDIPEYAIGGPVVYTQGSPLLIRHRIHQALSPFYKDLKDVLYVEGIVRNYITLFSSPKDKAYAIRSIASALQKHRTENSA